MQRYLSHLRATRHLSYRDTRSHSGLFAGRYERRVIPLIGHNVPQEAPHHGPIDTSSAAMV